MPSICCTKWSPRLVAKRMETVEGITDISQQTATPGGLQLSLVIDRETASSLGVRVLRISTTP